MKLLCWKPMSSRFKQMAAITTHSSGALWWKAMGTGRCGVFAVWKLCDPHLSASAVNSLLWGAIQMSFLVPCSGLILYYIVFYCKCGLFSEVRCTHKKVSCITLLEVQQSVIDVMYNIVHNNTNNNTLDIVYGAHYHDNQVIARVQ